MAVSKHRKTHFIHPTHMRCCSNSTITIHRINVFCVVIMLAKLPICLDKVVAKR